MIAKNQAFFYEGMVFVRENGSVYREVSRSDIQNGADIYSLEVQGLRYTSLENLLKRIRIDTQPFEMSNGVECVRHDKGDGCDVLRLTPTNIFTGISREKKPYWPELVYVTPVMVAVYNPNNSRSN